MSFFIYIYFWCLFSCLFDY